MAGEVRRLDWRKRARHGDAPVQRLTIEGAGADEVPVELLQIAREWIPLQVGDTRIVSTDVEPSRGRVDKVFWIAASEVPDGEQMERARFATFGDERYEIQSVQFFAGVPAHWELLVIFNSKLSIV